MEKQSDKRVLMIAALVYGLVTTAASARWLNTGEPIAGQIKSDHALFHPVCAAWGLFGLSMLVLTPLA